MQTINIKDSEVGQRLDKYLKRYFKYAEPSLLYKMLRKKNIVLNKSKANGTEILKSGDVINTFFSDETFSKFTGSISGSSNNAEESTDILVGYNEDIYSIYKEAYNTLTNIKVIYEDSDFVFMSKPVGIVSQTDENNKLSINEWLIGYLLSKEDSLDFKSFKPSISNRIDRNTSGLILSAKTYAGSRYLSDCIREHKLQKYYLAICHGKLEGSSVLKGYLKKDHNTNKVSIRNTGKDTDYIHTEYESLYSDSKYSMLKVKLITGKSHQIRAHLSSIGHPLVGDVKYGGKVIELHNQKYNYQLLHAYEIIFPEDSKYLSKKHIICPVPDIFKEICNVDIMI